MTIWGLDEDIYKAFIRQVAENLSCKGWYIEPDAPIITCTKCNYELESGFNFCPKCATKSPGPPDPSGVNDLNRAVYEALDKCNLILKLNSEE